MHPYNDSKERRIMIVFNIIVDFLNEYDLRPSKKLSDEYAQSELTKKLNTLPSRVYLNRKFDKDDLKELSKDFDEDDQMSDEDDQMSEEDDQMSEEVYERLRKRFYSWPPLVFFFNPNIELQEWFDSGNYNLKLGFFAAGTLVSANKKYWKCSNYYKFVSILFRYLKLNNYFYGCTSK